MSTSKSEFWISNQLFKIPPGCPRKAYPKHNSHTSLSSMSTFSHTMVSQESISSQTSPLANFAVAVSHRSANFRAIKQLPAAAQFLFPIVDTNQKLAAQYFFESALQTPTDEDDAVVSMLRLTAYQYAIVVYVADITPSGLPPSFSSIQKKFYEQNKTNTPTATPKDILLCFSPSSTAALETTISTIQGLSPVRVAMQRAVFAKRDSSIMLDRVLAAVGGLDNGLVASQTFSKMQAEFLAASSGRKATFFDFLSFAARSGDPEFTKFLY